MFILITEAFFGKNIFNSVKVEKVKSSENLRLIMGCDSGLFTLSIESNRIFQTIMLHVV